MSIQVENLEKIYGEQKALNGISFEANKGDILGFLGPNGAGKTTTMKILTCFIPKTSGVAKVCGLDTADYPMDIKKKIGYLPEHNPLYKDMYVREYLAFIAGLHKLDNVKQKVDKMIELTGLSPEKHKQIGALSKGYRQRVGLAQAMIHDPEVLILDEPTSGLDPNQLADIRLLIKQLAEEKTVIFSTHIMQEVEALCNKVVIINQGNIVANSTIEGLSHLVAGQQQLVVEFSSAVSTADLLKIKGVSSVKSSVRNKHVLLVDKRHDVRAEVFNYAVQNKLILLEMFYDSASVEDIFQKLTKLASA